MGEEGDESSRNPYSQSRWDKGVDSGRREDKGERTDDGKSAG